VPREQLPAFARAICSSILRMMFCLIISGATHRML
jgi:hypothetical protein